MIGAMIGIRLGIHNRFSVCFWLPAPVAALHSGQVGANAPESQ
jgi:hypothetical protein